MIDISTEIAGLKLSNPTILASGILDAYPAVMLRVSRYAGAVVTKSLSVKPHTGYKNPTFVEIEHGILNAIGLANQGVKKYSEELKKIKEKIGIPVIGSVFGSSKEEFVYAAEILSETVDAIELNLSCPHAKGYGIEIGKDKKLVYDIVKNVKDSIDVPVFPKISSDYDIVEIAKICEQAEADGIVAINSVKGMKIDIETGIPVLSNGLGGYSGPGIKPIGVRCVYEITHTCNLPVIGCGGILSGKDAIEYFFAGACSVEIGAGVFYRGEKIFLQICNEIKSWMKEKGYSKLSEIRSEIYS